MTPNRTAVRGFRSRGGTRRRELPTPTEQWQAEMRGIKAFLRRLPEHARIHGDKWADRMATYYRARLKHLEKNPPKP